MRSTKPAIARRLMALATVVVLGGCAAAPQVISDAGDIAELAADERRLWLMSDEIDNTLRKSGAVYTDQQASDYLQSLVAALLPEFAQHIRVRVLKNVEANAFAMANGSVYINTGMLLRLRNEAELAAIVSHEAAHVTHKHVVGNVRTAKRFNMVANIVGLGASFIAATSMASLSQAHEVEADVVGMSRMASAGYAPQAAAAPFQRLADELQARGISQAGLFRSHPQLQTRAASLAALAADLPNGRLHTERFERSLARVRLAALEQAVQGGHGDLLVFLLADEELREGFGSAGFYYLGEGYRLRDYDGDRERALRAYMSAVQQDSGDYRAHGRLGLLYMKAGDNARAINHFETYQANSTDAADADAAFVRGYLERLRRDSAP
ncbi:MAG: M48 family metalloprotease [Pseudomonadota bacterium]